jgi:DNA mismatch repair protein MSH6
MYTHSKYRYEIEVPVDFVDGKKKPKEFVLTSHKQGFQRFHTDTLKSLIEQLEEAEESLKDAISPFVCALFQRFHENRQLWQPAL